MLGPSRRRLTSELPGLGVAPPEWGAKVVAIDVFHHLVYAGRVRGHLVSAGQERDR
jgi:hypothetical protein